MSDSNPAMKALIEAINKLQQVFASAGLSLDKFHLPQIAVVGGQSAGKSSVLENFVGRDFLPRGADIVTRCPLLVQLIPYKEEYAVFGHLEERKFESFDDVRNEIENRTNELTGGTKKGISEKAIVLKVYSPYVVDLTLVDLPGLTKVPIGDQPLDIGDQIKKLVLKYITNENTLILAVSPANNDIANSDALQLAKEVDPDGLRTFGVITKLDLMDEGTDARDILKNKVYPLKRGYIGIVNRNQKAINSKKDIREAQKAEMEFIRKHKAYRDMERHMGSKYLQQILSKSLADHIKKKMPYLKDNLKKQKQDTKRQLETFPDYDGSEPMARRIVHEILHTFGTDSQKYIDGNSTDFSSQQLSTGAQIIQSFCFDFPLILARDHTAFKSKELLLMISNIRGLRYGQFVPEKALETCIKRLVEIYKEPCDDCIDKIAEILREMVTKLCQNIQHYPKLEEKIRDLCYDCISDYENVTKVYIKTFIESEGSFVNTRHPDFKSIASVEEIPVEYYREIEAYWEKENPKTLIPTFFPSVNLKATEKNKIIHEASAIVKEDRELIGQYQLLVLSQYLAFYKNQGKLDKFQGKVRTEKLEVEDIERSAQLKLTSSGRPFPMGGKQIILQFTNEGEKLEFQRSLQQTFANISVNMTEKDEQIDEDEVEEEESSSHNASKINMKMDRNRHEQLEIIAYMVDNYMKITHKGISDVLPKCIRNLLVNKLLDYVQKNMIENIDQKQQELLDIDPEDIERKKELNEILQATNKALDTLNAMSLNFSKI